MYSNLSSETVDDDNDISEPSAIDRRLKEERSYNDGDWTSEELKKLYDHLDKYGTQDIALIYACERAIRSKTQHQIQTKVDEIRELISEHKEDCVSFFRREWISKGAANIKIPKDFLIHNPETHTWIAAVRELRSKMEFRSKKDHVFRSISKSLEELARTAPPEKTVKVTENSTEKTQALSWEQIYRFLVAALSCDTVLPPINQLEASVILNVLYDIDDEADQTPEDTKAVIKGLHADLCMGEMRLFLPDYPCSRNSAAQVILDPLRTRLWGVPKPSTDIEFDDNPLMGDHASASSSMASSQNTSF